MNAPDTPARPGRLTSVDAYRGFVMFLMMAEVLHLRQVAAAHPGSALWALLGHHQEHAEWVGCSLHDLIQPSFSFLVGVALPFSLAGRAARGQSRRGMIIHAAWRAGVLVALGIFLRSVNSNRTNFTFEDTLTQIGLGYPFLFVLGMRSVRVQWAALVAILVGYWAAFALYPTPGTGFDYPAVFVPREWPHLLNGFAAHWNKNSNPAWAFDRWFLNLFPRNEPFVANRGGYATLSFVPTLATMVLGLIAGGIVRSTRPTRAKIVRLVAAGVLGLALGYAAGLIGVCPVVKRIWTPSWVLFSGGWCFLLLAGFYAVIDVAGWKAWSFPLVVVGMNSIAAYCASGLLKSFIVHNLKTHFGAETFRACGPAHEPLLSGAAVLLVLWLLLFGMYRQRIFVRV